MLLAAAAMMTSAERASASTYTAIANGSWTNPNVWASGTTPSYTLSADQVIIPPGVIVLLDRDATVTIGSGSSVDVSGSLSGNTDTLVMNGGSLTGLGNISMGEVAVNGGATMSFAGSMSARSFTSSASNLHIGGFINISGSLNLLGGNMTLDNDGVLNLFSNTNIYVGGGSIAINGGVITFPASYNVTYINGPVTAGMELSGAGLTNVTVNAPGSAVVTLTTDLAVRGSLNLMSGTLALGGHDLTLNGDLNVTGGKISSTAASNVALLVNASPSSPLAFAANGNSVKNLSIDVDGGGTFAMGSDMSVAGTLYLMRGYLNLNSHALTLSGDIGVASGMISTQNGSLILNARRTPTGSLIFAGNGNTLDNLTIDMADSAKVAIGTNVLINGNLNMMSGLLDIGSNGIRVSSSGSVSGGNHSSYVVSSGTGHLAIDMASGTNTWVTYPVGTMRAYAPVALQLNANSTSGPVDVYINDGVMAQGTTGTDLSLTEPSVATTYFIEPENGASMDLNMQLMWMRAGEVNRFDRSQAYISHYTSGAWDQKGYGAATMTRAGIYSLERDHLTTFSPFAVYGKAGAGNTGISPLAQAEAEPQFYPNPATSVLYVTDIPAGGQPVQMEIFSLDGQKVGSYTLTDDLNTIPVTALTDGQYNVRFHNDQIDIVKDFIKLEP